MKAADKKAPDATAADTKALEHDRGAGEAALLQTWACSWACLKVLYSSHYGPSPKVQILPGLKRLLADQSATCVLVGDYILLLGAPQAVTRTVCGRAIGWLLAQPEVVFVHRLKETGGTA